MVFGVPIKAKRTGLKHNNNPIERENGNIKDRIKVMRGGFGSFEGAKGFMNLRYIIHNFVNPHQTIKKTPAEAAEIKLPLKRNRLHDTKDALPIINKLCQHYQPSIFYADRGYDANYVFKAVFEKLKAYPLILQKRLDVPKHRRKGEYRKLTVDEFDYGEYLQRNKVETTMSILKRRHGFTIKSRHVKCQKAETLCRIIAHNVERLLRQGKEIILTFVRITRVSY